jgi:transcriptional regulator with XRE-family HTH domain
MKKQKDKQLSARKVVKKERDPKLVELGARIRHFRIKKGYTSSETFAYENDIPRAQYGRYENGEDLRYSSLLRVLDALGVSLKEFFGEGFSK